MYRAFRWHVGKSYSGFINQYSKMNSTFNFTLAWRILWPQLKGQDSKSFCGWRWWSGDQSTSKRSLVGLFWATKSDSSWRRPLCTSYKQAKSKLFGIFARKTEGKIWVICIFTKHIKSDLKFTDGKISLSPVLH